MSVSPSAAVEPHLAQPPLSQFLLISDVIVGLHAIENGRFRGSSAGKRRPEPHGHKSFRPSFSTSSVSMPTMRLPRLTRDSLEGTPGGACWLTQKNASASYSRYMIVLPRGNEQEDRSQNSAAVANRFPPSRPPGRRRATCGNSGRSYQARALHKHTARPPAYQAVAGIAVPRQISRPVASQSGPFACPCRPSGPQQQQQPSALAQLSARPIRSAAACRWYGYLSDTSSPLCDLGRAKWQEVLSNAILGRLQTTIRALIVCHSSGPPRSALPWQASQADLSGTGHWAASPKLWSATEPGLAGIRGTAQ